MRKLIAQWWHSRVLKHDQASISIYDWEQPEDSAPRCIRINCACGAVWSHY